MLVEHKELQDKIAKLEMFISENPVFNNLTYDEQCDMRIQLIAMQTYAIVLTRRIERAAEPSGAIAPTDEEEQRLKNLLAKRDMLQEQLTRIFDDAQCIYICDLDYGSRKRYDAIIREKAIVIDAIEAIYAKRRKKSRTRSESATTPTVTNVTLTPKTTKK